MEISPRAKITGSWLQDQAALQLESWFLWAPVFMGAGIAVFFALPSDPPLTLSATLAALIAACLYSGRRIIAANPPLLLIAFLVLGFVAAHMRTQAVGAPILPQEMKMARITATIGTVENMDQDAKQLRFVLRDLEVEGLMPPQTPAKARLTVRSKESLAGRYQAGDQISGLASLKSPSRSSIPGGFDFQRYMYFKRIGALGFFYGAPDITQKAPPSALNNFVQNLRMTIADKLRRTLAPEAASVASALIIGQRGAMEDAALENMRAAGLAHMLAISGLHVGLVSGIVFFVLRLLMALVPALALNWPIKKIAAVLAFVVACFYMLLAGGTIPTQRALLMVGIVFLAVLTDRTAISMRLVALAACGVLLIQPESVLTASFQLSFAAVAALIFVFEAVRPLWGYLQAGKGLWRSCALYVGGLMATSLVAAIATAPFALYHFQQVALLGLGANALAMPVLSFIVMPFSVLAVMLMPLGLENLALWPAGQGIEVILKVASLIAAQEQATWHVHALPRAGLALITLGALGFMLIKGPLRLSGLVILLAGIALSMPDRKPDIFIAGSHDLWGYYSAAEGLQVSSRAKERFTRNIWESTVSLEEGSAKNWKEAKAISCDPLACRLILKGYKISFLYEKEALPAECHWADILIIGRTVSQAECAAPYIIDYQKGKNLGAHVIYLTDQAHQTQSFAGPAQAPRIESVNKNRPNRIWAH